MACVIKAGKIIPSGTAVQHAEFNLEDMSQNASKYLDSVKHKAAQIVAQAQQQVRQMLVQAEQQGRQAAVEQAEKTALEAVEAKWQTLTPALQHAIDGTEQLKSAWMRHWEANLVQLVVAVAERVVRGELTRKPEIPQQWVRESLELAAGSDNLTLHLNPDDYEALGDQRQVIVREFGKLTPADVVPDPGITSGGCRVVTEYGHIDQQVESQLARIQQELTG